jgi:subtilisin family serine protease
VAIIDTGADRAHPDLNRHISIARNFVDDGDTFDNEIHGTAVAGIIVAGANNHVGIVGLAPDADVLMLKACWQLNVDEIAARCNSFTLAKALSFAIEQRADIINLSLGGPADPLLAQLLRVAIGRDILVIAAQDPRAQFPAGVPGVIAVNAAAGTDIDALARTVKTRSDIAGNEPKIIFEADANELLSTSPKGRYDYFSGSSMAAARVTALSALMRQQQRSLSSVQLLKSFNQWLASPPTVAQSP